jgi:hypothetical protein
MDRRKLAYYLLLNVFVSACVTSGILYWYDRNYRAASLPPLTSPGLPSDATATPRADVQSGAIQIASVVGAGTVSAESVVIRYNGSGELDLTGWQLKDADGNTYVFPPFKLVRNGAVQVHTAGGTDTAIDLYWGLRDAVWGSGETALLVDPQGQLQDSYPVP